MIKNLSNEESGNVYIHSKLRNIIQFILQNMHMVCSAFFYCGHIISSDELTEQGARKILSLAMSFLALEPNFTHSSLFELTTMKHSPDFISMLSNNISEHIKTSLIQWMVVNTLFWKMAGHPIYSTVTPQKWRNSNDHIPGITYQTQVFWYSLLIFTTGEKACVCSSGAEARIFCNHVYNVAGDAVAPYVTKSSPPRVLTIQKTILSPLLSVEKW